MLCYVMYAYAICEELADRFAFMPSFFYGQAAQLQIMEMHLGAPWDFQPVPSRTAGTPSGPSARNRFHQLGVSISDVPKNGRFIRKNPTNMDDLGVPLF